MSLRTPLVGIPTCFREVNERVMYTAVVRYPHAVVDAARCLPMLIPSLGDKLDIDALLDTIDGLLLTGSPSNVEPYHYNGPPSRDLPVLAICRGIQELNVALGGTLHQRIGERPGGEVHRRSRDVKRIMELTMDERYGPCHPVAVAPDGVFAKL